MAQVLSPGQIIETAIAPQVEEEWRQNLNVQLMCPDCREYPPNIVEEFSSGDCVCGSCGLVLGDRIIDTRSEWRTFANDESGNDDPSRVGAAANPLFNGAQLETAISFGDGGQRSRELNRAHAKITNQNKSNKNLKEVYQRITAICTPLHLSSDIIDTTSQLYKATEDVKFLKGKNVDAIIAGCLFIACRQMNSPRTFKEINKATRVSKKEIGRTFKVLQSHFSNQKRKAAGIPAAGNINLIGESYQNKSSTRANELCDRYCDALQLSMNSSKVARGIAERMSATGSLAGRSPLSAAAACIYMASHLMGEPKSPKEIAAVAEVSDGTIRTSYKELFKVADELIDPVWLTTAYGGDKSRLPSA